MGRLDPRTVIQGWAERDPDRLAITGATQLTYAQLWERARRLANAWRTAGLVPGDALLAIMPNCWQGIVIEVAAAVAGACFIPRSVHISSTVASTSLTSSTFVALL